MTMNSYLESQIPYLRALHNSLGLASSELANDLHGIEEAIKQAIDTRVKIRKDAVKELEERIAKVQKRVGKMRAVLGEEWEDQRDTNSDLSLPAKLGSLDSEEARLKSTHEDRIMKIRALTGQIIAISTVLGKTYSLPPELQLKMSSSAHSLQTSAPPPYSNEKQEHTIALCDSAEEEVENASLGRIAALEEALRLVHLEKVKRTEQLNDLMDDLRFLHGELCLPASCDDSARASWFISGSVPLEKSIAHLPYVDAFIVSINSGDDAVQLLTSDPTESLMDFCTTLQATWLAEKSRREARIQTLFDEIEPIWLRLQVSQEEVQTFIEEHCGLALSTIQAYESELERVQIMRGESLGGFIQAVREEIQGLWDRLLYGPRTMGQFGAFYDDAISEDLLALHETEAQRLSDELESKGALLSKAQEWVDLKAKEEELEVKRNGPDRFNTRGGALLQEEKMRKRLGILKPKLEAELLHMVPLWEEDNDLDFLVDDIRIVDIITLEQEAKDAEKEAKKRTKIMGHSVTPARQTRAPTAMSAHRTPMASSISVSREAPTPTPYQKGHRVMRVANPLASSTSSVPSSQPGMRNVNPLACSTSSISSMSANAGLRRQAPPPAYSLPRPTAGRNYTMPQAKPLGTSAAHNVIQPRIATHGTLSSGIPKITGNTAILSRDGTRRPRRESFKPRRSVVSRVDSVASTDIKSWRLEDFVEEL